MTKTQLSPGALKLLQGSPVAQAKIAERFDKKLRTVENWIKENDPLLCHPDVISIFKEAGFTEGLFQVITV